MRLVMLILVTWSVPAWADNDFNLLVPATQAYATCIATEASNTSVSTSTTATERVRAALDECTTLRQRVADALDPRGRTEFFARIDRDIQSVALEFAEKAVANAN